MINKLLLIFSLLFFSVTLSAQKKQKVVKVAHVVKTVNNSSLLKISPERNLRMIKRDESEKSLVVLKNNYHLLPLNRLDTLKTIVVSLGMGMNNPMPKLIGRYIKADYLTISQNSKLETIRQNISKVGFYNLIILAIGEQTDGYIAANGNGAFSNSSVTAEQSFNDKEKLLLGGFRSDTKTIFMLFGSSSFLSHWTASERATAIVTTGMTAYDNTDLSTQLIFGAIAASGKLTDDLGHFKKGEGIIFPAINRLSYILPEEVGVDSMKFSQRMDSLVAIGLKAKAFPGCQLLCAKTGKVFYQKSYGYYTYDHLQAVQDDDIYDLASVTKVLAPVPALMMLADQNKFQVNKKMSDYWPDWKGSNKENILVSDLLSHQARLKPGVVLWPKTLDEQGHFRSEYYAMQPAPGYSLRVSRNLYLVDSFPDTVYKVIRDSPLLKTKKYAYSDLGFVLLPKVIENLSGQSYLSFLNKRLYSRLGASTLTYNPYLYVPGEKIVPTEDDQSFRHELLQGFVHDETAALLGGVSGNAGLFGSAGDVAKVMQLYLQNGDYGNERYIAAETLKNWTSSHFQKTNNRRGYGFDKPAVQTSKKNGEREVSLAGSF